MSIKNVLLTLGTTGFFAGAIALAPSSASAQMDPSGECSGGLCGTPDQSGGGCGCGCGCSILIARTDRGDTYQFGDDYDGDGIEDEYDNAPFFGNPDQGDADGDGVGDVGDICPSFANALQEDYDGDALGDACDDDRDGDLVLNPADNCPFISNRARAGIQGDMDTDGLGDACDSDADGDGLDNGEDDCAFGTICDRDLDGDTVDDELDVCLGIADPLQLDTDHDGFGDLCDADRDGDGLPNITDNCAELPNLTQEDRDHDRRGDLCDDKPDCWVLNQDESAPGLEDGLCRGAAFAVGSIRLRGLGIKRSYRLPAFINRRTGEFGTATYSWELLDGPRGAKLTDSRGETTVNAEGKLEQDGKLFVALPGTYRVRVTVTLDRDDVAGLGEVTSVYETELEALEVDGDEVGDDGGCTVSSNNRGTGAFTALLGIAAVAFFQLRSRRRRR